MVKYIDVEKVFCADCEDRDRCGSPDIYCDVHSMPLEDVAPVVHGEWVLTAHEEYSNYRWHVTAECSECHHDKGEIYAGFFPGFPKDLARGVVLDCAESVKLDNFCPNCGAKMDGERKGDDA